MCFYNTIKQSSLVVPILLNHLEAESHTCEVEALALVLESPVVGVDLDPLPLLQALLGPPPRDALDPQAPEDVPHLGIVDLHPGDAVFGVACEREVYILV